MFSFSDSLGVFKSAFFLTGIVVALLVWIIDPFIDTLFLQQGTIYQRLFHPDLHEVLTRSYISAIIIMMSFISGFLLNRSKQTEKALRESEQRISVIVNNARDAIIMMNPKGLITFWNPAAEKMFGYSIAQAQDKNLHSLLAPQRYREAAEKGMRYSQNTGGAAFFEKTHEYEALRKDGSEFSVELSASVIKLNGEWHTSAIIRDITERKLMLQSYEDIFMVSPDMLAVCTPDGKFLKINPPWEIVLGRKLEELLKLGWSGLVHPDDVESTKKQVQKQFKGSPVVNFINRLQCKDGSYRTLEWQATYVKDGVVHASARDITERKRADDQVIKSQKRLRNLAARLLAVREEERMTIAREIHDELGQSLTGLKIDLAWILEHAPKRSTKLAERARASLLLADETLETVRRISHELRPAMLDDLGLEAAIEWQVEEFSKRTSCECKLVVKTQDIGMDDVRDTVTFRILQEALTNVARHARASQVIVTLSSASAQLVLEVADNGCGIKKAELESNNSLGLIGMWERASAVGGRVDITGNKRAGTEVRLELPLKFVSIAQQGGKLT